MAPTAPAPPKNILSIDVEDWFHILDLPTTPDYSEWDALPSIVEKNFLRLLDMLEAHGTRATCFFLAWVARKHPHLVLEAHRRGHEVASHGTSHRLVYTMNQREFHADIVGAKQTLEDITGAEVLGYRAPGFSVTQETPWFFDTLIKAGYKYDSSLFPAARAHGGMQTTHLAPYIVREAQGAIIELPITVTPVLGKNLCFFGGGYLRLFPYFLIKRMARKVNSEGRPVVFYVHPREIDPSAPRLKMGLARRFKSYVNLDTTERKIQALLSDFHPVPFRDYLMAEEEFRGLL